MAPASVLPTEDSAPALQSPAVPGMLPPAILHEDEIIVLLIKPSLWFVFFRTIRPLLLIMLLGILAEHIQLILNHLSPGNVALLTLLIASGRLMWDALVWTSHTYVLTNQRIMTLKGVFNVVIFQAPLRKIQRCAVYQPLYDRLLGLGNVGFATASTDAFDSVWLTIARPVDVARQIFNAIEKQQ